MESHVEKIVICGGGLAGWLTAAALARAFRERPREIVVIDHGFSGKEGALVGAGEGALESIRALHSILGLDENELMRRTQATFKLGVAFHDWRAQGGSYFHGFGEVGLKVGAVAFHQLLVLLRARGEAFDIGDFSPSTVAAKAGRFERPKPEADPALPAHSYSLHLDVALYRNGLRAYAAQGGVREIEGAIKDVALAAENGFIEAIVLEGGRRVEGDLFIDCTGDEALLIGKALGVGFEDWSRWLPCDRIVALSAAATAEPVPYTTARAHEAGWLRRIPLQLSVDHAYVYSSAHLDEDRALAALRAALSDPPLGEPRRRALRSGRRAAAWVRNCVAIGEAACMLDPLEATDLHMLQSGVVRLIGLFPYRDCNAGEAEEYSRLVAEEAERIRDFTALHYATAHRPGEAFWEERKTAGVPDSLHRKMDLFESRGLTGLLDGETFFESSWATAFFGQGIVPRRYDPLADCIADAGLGDRIRRLKDAVATAVLAMPRHSDYILRNCATPALQRASRGGESTAAPR